MSDTNESNTVRETEKDVIDYWAKYCPCCGKEFTDPTPCELSYWTDIKSQVYNTRIRCPDCTKVVNIEFQGYLSNDGDDSSEVGDKKPPMSY